MSNPFMPTLCIRAGAVYCRLRDEWAQPCSVVSVARCLVCNHSPLHLPCQGDGVGRSFATSWFPVTYYSPKRDNWQDVYQVMSNTLSPAAPNLLFGCCCHIISISSQGQRSAERKSWRCGNEIVTKITALIPLVENLGLWRVKGSQESLNK